MKAYDKLRMSLMIYSASLTHKISQIPDYYYNRLRYRYHKGLPASFYMLFNNIPDNSSITRCLLFTTIFDASDDYRIITGMTKLFGRHTYIERNGEIYDIDLNLICPPQYYQQLFNPTNKIVNTKECIEDFIKEYNVGQDSIDNVYKVPLHILDDIKDQKDKYTGKHKELIDRQVDSFFRDINYEDGLLFIDTGKEKGTR